MQLNSVATLFTFLFFVSLVSAQPISVTNLATGSPTNLRGASIADDGSFWVSGSNGYVGRYVPIKQQCIFSVISGFEKAELRDIHAFDSLTAIVMSSTQPAAFLKTTDGGVSWREIFRNNSPEYFLDGFDFWENGKGICIGDPINNSFLILTTNDFGETWRIADSSEAPSVSTGVYAFAASGTSIQCLEKGIVKFGTGGKSALLFTSKDYGKSWKFFNTSIIAGTESTGIFSIDFMRNNFGCITGGDYNQPNLIESNFYYTHKKNNWKPAGKMPGGYRSCIQYIGDDMVICCGINGVDIASTTNYSFTSIDNQTFNTIAYNKKTGFVILAGSDGKVSQLNYK